MKSKNADINNNIPFGENAALDIRYTPLQLAIDHLNINCIQALIECNANPKVVQSGEPNLLNLAAIFFMTPTDCSKIIGILNLLKSHFEPLRVA